MQNVITVAMHWEAKDKTISQSPFFDKVQNLFFPSSPQNKHRINIFLVGDVADRIYSSLGEAFSGCLSSKSFCWRINFYFCYFFLLFFFSVGVCLFALETRARKRKVRSWWKIKEPNKILGLMSAHAAINTGRSLLLYLWSHYRTIAVEVPCFFPPLVFRNQ